MMICSIAGCKVSKDIPLPDAAPESYRSTSVVTDSVTIGSIAFKDFIKDVTIQKLIDTALVKNFDMQIAIKNIDAAEQLFKQSKLANLPEVRLQISANSSRPSDNSLNGFTLNQFLGTTHIEDYNANVGVLWEADIWGKIRNQKAGALASYLQTEEARKAVQTKLIANITQGYYQLLMLDSQLDIAKKNVELSESTLKVITLQFDSGLVTSLAVQQAQAQHLQSKKLIPSLEQNIIIQENALSILTGNLPAAINRAGTLNDMVLPDNLKVGFPSTLLQFRPDIKNAELALKIANAKVGIAHANLYPSLIVSASGGINSFKASNWFNIPASLFGLVSGGIAQPLFQRGQLKTNVEIEKIEREKTVIRFRQLVINAVGEVSDELIKLEKLQEQYDLGEKRNQTLQDASKNARLLFQSGMANYLEILIAESNLLQGELELASIKTEQLKTVVGLYRSLGGEWH